MTLRSDRLLIDNSPGHESLKDINGNLYVGEVEGVDNHWGQEDCHSLFDRYHEMIRGDLSAGRIDSVSDMAVGTRQMVESFEKEQEVQNDELESLKETQKDHETAIGKITAILDRIDNSMKQRDDAFEQHAETLINLQRQQETIHQTLNRLAYSVTALADKIMNPLVVLKQEIKSYDDVNCVPIQRQIENLSSGQRKEVKRHIAGLFW